ncbi:MAG: adenylosuccinate synthase [Candidatus Peribacteraceae bacterium]|nr:adenylosuccinate synthase [Candidatus Peribacteraceae bacterium]
MQSLLQSLGPVTAVIGAQWGDEGKGKATDILGEHYDVIARACGGANAGHTVIVKGKKHVFHLLPAGTLHAGKPVILGSGMVIHLPTLLEEIKTVEDAGIPLMDRLFISGAAHVICEYHKQVDGALEDRRGRGGIGTTRRGIGPAYMDKAERVGIRMEQITENLHSRIEERAKTLHAWLGITVNIEKELAEIRMAADILRSCIVSHMPLFLHEFLKKGKTMLLEGAQASLLDIDHGTYPYVTSSSTTVAGALQGLGLPPRVLTSSIGVTKAYCTRVGSGVFLTEDLSERGERLRERGGEYGATTGRPRRCGWLHLPELKYSAILNGFTCLNMTKLDVLDEEEEIPVGTALSSSGGVTYKNLKGWKQSTVGMTDFKQLPSAAQEYIRFIEQEVGVPIRLIGTGPGREEIIVR